MLSNSDFLNFYFSCFLFFFGCAVTDNLVPLSITVSLGEAELLGACQEMVIQAVDLVCVSPSGFSACV